VKKNQTLETLTFQKTFHRITGEQTASMATQNSFSVSVSKICKIKSRMGSAILEKEMSENPHKFMLVKNGGRTFAFEQL